MKLLIGILILIAFIAFAKGDECTFKAQTCYSVSQIKKCLDLFPLDKEQKELTIGQVKRGFQIHPLTDVLSKVGVNVFDNLRKIAKKKYQNEFDFHFDIFHDIAQNIPDFSTSYTPPTGFLRFRISRPFSFVPEGSTKRFKIASISSRYTLPADLVGREVVSVDGASVSDYIANQFFFNGNEGQQFMYNYLNQPSGSRLVYSGVPSSDKVTFKFADKTSLDVNICVFATIDIENVTTIQNLNLPTSPSKKRSEQETERCISKLGVCFEKEKTFEQVKVEKRNKEGTPTLVKFESSTLGYAQRGIVQHDGNKLPFLRLISFDKTDKTWKQVVVNFVKQLSRRKSPLAIIDLTQYNFGGDFCETEWIINLLSQTSTQPFQKDTYKTKTYRTLFDSRVSNKFGRFVFSENYANSIFDPTSGLLFEDSFCPTENPIKRNRNGSKQLFTPKFFQNQCKDFIKPFKFPTKFIILTNTNCGGVCSLFQSVLRKTGVAKIVGIGGLTGKPLAVNFAYYGGYTYDWNVDIAPIFPLTEGIKPLPTSASFAISDIEAYLSDSKLPEAVSSLFADEVIGWDKYVSPFSSVLVPSPPLDLYVLASKIDPKVEKVELPSFQPKSKCYAEKRVPEEKH